MCTVTFIPLGTQWVITSNRDEHPSRPAATAPATEIVNGALLTFPRDPLAGGTWFAVNERGRATVLLNGAFVKHTKTGNYARSRGLVLLDVASNPAPLGGLDDLDLTRIEPFTVVLAEAETLLEMRWDGQQLHRRFLDPTLCHIWSSVTLYPPDVVAWREQLFARFLADGLPDTHRIRQFHLNNYGDDTNGFRMNRPGEQQTFSVTQAVREDGVWRMAHLDLT